MGIEEEFLKIKLEDMGKEIEDIILELNEAVEVVIHGDLQKAITIIETARSRLATLCIGNCRYCWKECNIECHDCNICPMLFECISRDKIDFSRKI
jgi:hypothetical protein